ncbi:MAG: HAMP domain-containing histidine kinase [Catenulispora sp.]|nr:HAMP domain-containing histidine kinase [Catenulispora sp.]
MSTTTEATPPPPDVAPPSGAGQPAAPRDPYLRGTDETVLLDLRELRAQQAAQASATAGAAAGDAAGTTPGSAIVPAGSTAGADLEAYQGSHRREAMLYAHGGTAIPLERVREVCHDLRQPVAAILMLASAAEMRPDVPERVRDVLQEIMTQTEDISATVRQFLDDAKQGVDGLGDPVPCNVAGLAAESVERWRATFSGRISLSTAEEPLHVTVDPVLFKRALGNVLSNGTRAAGGTGRVQVTVRRFETAQGERAVIEVDDSGPGFGNIPAGHGLGLAVVRRTVEAAGGAVEVGEGPLGGALIRLVLPVTPARPLSSGDELARTIHGEVSLSALAEELAAGGGFSEFEDFEEYDDLDDFDDSDGFDKFDDFDELGGHEGFAAFDWEDDPSTVSGGHAFATRISALPEATAISGAPQQTAISGGPASPAFDVFRAPGRMYPAVPAPPAVAQTAPQTASQPAPAPQPAFPAPQPPAALPAPAQALEAPVGQPGPVAATTAPATAAIPTPATAPALPDREPVRITATGQDDTAVAAIQLPSRADLTHPPRIPASALRPVASVQLSLLPGGAF